VVWMAAYGAAGQRGEARSHEVPPLVSDPPSVRPRAVLIGDGTAANIHVWLYSLAGERIRLSVRDEQTGQTWSTGYLPSGTEAGPTTLPVLSAVPLLPDQVRTLSFEGEGERSKLRSGWVSLTLSLQERPWTESVDLAWNEELSRLELTHVAGVRTRSAELEISQDEDFLSGVLRNAYAQEEGEVRTLYLALTPADRDKVWHGRARAFNGPLYGGNTATGLGGIWVRDSAYVPPLQRPVIDSIRQVEREDLTTGLMFRVLAPRAQGGTLYVHTNKANASDANPDAASGTLAIGATPFVAEPATAFAGGVYALAGIPVWPGRGKTVFLRFVSSDGGDTGIVPVVLHSAKTLLRADGSIIDEAIDRPAAFAASIRPLHRVTTRPASGDYPGHRVAAEDTGLAWEWDAVAAEWTALEDGGGYGYIPFVVANSISAREVASHSITAAHLNVATVYATGLQIHDNTPAGSVAWDAFTIEYQGNTYPIAAGAAHQPIAYWWNDPTLVGGIPGNHQLFGAYPHELHNSLWDFDTRRGDAIIILNENGIGRQVWNGTQIYGGQIDTNAIQARHLSTITMEAGKWVRSSNYIAGTQGFSLEASGGTGNAGRAEFNDVDIRGTLYGVDGTFGGDLAAAGGTFGGTVVLNAESTAQEIVFRQSGAATAIIRAAGNSIQITTTSGISGIDVAPNLVSIHGAAIYIQGMPIDYGANNSGGTGYRVLRVPN
jgi:hypothetical protein